MKAKNLVIIILILLVIGAGGFYFFSNLKGYNKPGGQTNNNDDQNHKNDLITADSPKPNDLVKSPFLIRGQARGNWYFEATFPAQLYDRNGKLLGQKPIRAQGDWMTENFVPFEEQFEFTDPTVDTGYLLLKKDNPSGLPELDNELRIPVRFEPSSEVIKLKVYFNNNNLDPEISCNKVFPVEREVPTIQAIARAAVEELLKGVMQSEKDQGFFTSINPNVKIQKLTIENGTAKIDFNEQLEFQVGGSCRVSAIRSQITQTLKQFSTVNQVIISINNRIEDILQP